MQSKIPFKKKDIKQMIQKKQPKRSELYQLLKSLKLIKSTEYKKATIQNMQDRLRQYEDQQRQQQEEQKQQQEEEKKEEAPAVIKAGGKLETLDKLYKQEEEITPQKF